MLDAGCSSRHQIETSGHSEVQKHRILIVGFEYQIFAPATDGGEFTAFHTAAENKVGLASGTFQKAVPLFWQGHYYEANELVKESLRMYKKLGVNDEFEFSFATNYMHLGEYDVSLKYARQGVMTYRKQQDKRNSALCRATEGWVALAQQDFQLADQIVLYQAPFLLGDKARGGFELGELTAMEQRVTCRIYDTRQLGKDLRLTMSLNQD